MPKRKSRKKPPFICLKGHPMPYKLDAKGRPSHPCDVCTPDIGARPGGFTEKIS